MGHYKSECHKVTAGNYANGGRVPIPKERPSSADAEWNNSIEGRNYQEEQRLKKPEGSWFRKAIFGK